MIYLDNNATTFMCQSALDTYCKYAGAEYSNPGSLHQLGQKSLSALDEGREKLAEALGAAPEEIIFTASGTEANNLCLQGILKKGGSLAVSGSEHSSIHNQLPFLLEQGAKVQEVQTQTDGLLNMESLERALETKPELLSVMGANNETGVCLPIADIGEKTEAAEVFFHTDLSQVAGKCAIDFASPEYRFVDFATFSPHKFHGPKGIGFLFARKPSQQFLNPVMFGGLQEFGFRPGTENLPGIMAAVSAFLETNTFYQEQASLVQALRDKLLDGLLKIPGCRLNGKRENLLPHCFNIRFEGADSDALILNLDLVGICASAGSACESRSATASRVLTAMGLSEDAARCSVRFALSRYTREDEINKCLKIIPPLVQRIQAVRG